MGGPPPPGAPASREARTRARAFGPPCRRDAGAPRQLTDEWGREDPHPDRRAQGQPPSRPPPFQGGGEKTARPAFLFGHRERSPTAPLTPPPWKGRPQGDRIWKSCGGAPTSPSPGRGRAWPPSSLLPPSGGGRSGGGRPWVRRVPPASREARTRMRAFGPSGRRDAGAPRQFTDERGREDPHPGRRAPGSTPSRPPPFQGGGEKTARSASLFGHRERPNGGP